MIRERPLTYVEESRTLRRGRNFEIEKSNGSALHWLAGRPASRVLMDTSVYPNLVASRHPLRQTINESDLTITAMPWPRRPRTAAVVLAFDGDQIDQAVKAHPQGLTAVRRFYSDGQPAGTNLYSNTAQNPK